MLPVDVRERVELLSDGWIDAARRWLEDAVAGEPAFASGSYSVCETFTDAPPALGYADNRAVWHFQITEGRVEAGRGDLPGADARITGDYQAVLAMSQTVYAAGKEAKARAERELRHRHGKDVVRWRAACTAIAPR